MPGSPLAVVVEINSIQHDLDGEQSEASGAGQAAAEASSRPLTAVSQQTDYAGGEDWNENDLGQERMPMLATELTIQNSKSMPHSLLLDDTRPESGSSDIDATGFVYGNPSLYGSLASKPTAIGMAKESVLGNASQPTNSTKARPDDVPLDKPAQQHGSSVGLFHRGAGQRFSQKHGRYNEASHLNQTIQSEVAGSRTNSQVSGGGIQKSVSIQEPYALPASSVITSIWASQEVEHASPSSHGVSTNAEAGSGALRPDLPADLFGLQTKQNVQTPMRQSIVHQRLMSQSTSDSQNLNRNEGRYGPPSAQVPHGSPVPASEYNTNMLTERSSNRVEQAISSHCGRPACTQSQHQTVGTEPEDSIDIDQRRLPTEPSVPPSSVEDAARNDRPSSDESNQQAAATLGPVQQSSPGPQHIDIVDNAHRQPHASADTGHASPAPMQAKIESSSATNQQRTKRRKNQTSGTRPTITRPIQNVAKSHDLQGQGQLVESSELMLRTISEANGISKVSKPTAKHTQVPATNQRSNATPSPQQLMWLLQDTIMKEIHDNRLAPLLEDIKVLEQNVRQLELTNKESQQQFGQVSKELKEKGATLSAEQNRSHELQTQLEGYQEKYKSLEVRLDSARQETVELTDAVSKKEEQINTLERKLTDLASSTAEQLDSAGSKRREQEKALKEANEVLVAYKEQLKAAQESASTTEVQLNGQILALERQLQQSASQVSTLKSSLGASKATLSQVTKELQERFAQIPETVATDLATAKTNLEQLDQKLQKLDTSVPQTLKRLSDSLQQLEATKEGLATACKERDQLRMENAALNEKLENINQKAKTLLRRAQEIPEVNPLPKHQGHDAVPEAVRIELEAENFQVPEAGLEESHTMLTSELMRSRQPLEDAVSVSIAACDRLQGKYRTLLEFCLGLVNECVAISKDRRTERQLLWQEMENTSAMFKHLRNIDMIGIANGKENNELRSHFGSELQGVRKTVAHGNRQILGMMDALSINIASQTQQGQRVADSLKQLQDAVVDVLQQIEQTKGLASHIETQEVELLRGMENRFLQALSEVQQSLVTSQQLQEANNVLQQSVTLLEKEKELWQTQRAGFEQTESAMRAEIDERQQRTVDLESTQTQHIDAALQDLRERLDQAKEELGKKDQEISYLQECLHGMKLETEGLMEQLSEKDRICKEHADEKVKMAQQAEQMESERTKLRKNAQRHEQELQARFENEIRRREQAVKSKSEKEMLNMNVKLHKVEQERELIKQQHDKLQQQLQNLQSLAKDEKTKHSQEHTRSSEIAQSLQLQLKESQQSVANLQAQLSKKDEAIKVLESANNTSGQALQQHIETLKKSSTKERAKATSLEQNLDKANAELRSIKEAQERDKEATDQLTAELTMAKAATQQAVSLNAAAVKAKEHALSQISNLNDQLQQQKEVADVKTKQLQIQDESFRKQQEQAEHELHQLGKKHQKEIDDLQKQLRLATQQQKNSQESHLKALQQAEGVIKGEREKTKAELGELKRQLTDLDAAKKTAEKDCQDIQGTITELRSEMQDQAASAAREKENLRNRATLLEVEGRKSVEANLRRIQELEQLLKKSEDEAGSLRQQLAMMDASTPNGKRTAATSSDPTSPIGTTRFRKPLRPLGRAAVPSKLQPARNPSKARTLVETSQPLPSTSSDPFDSPRAEDKENRRSNLWQSASNAIVTSSQRSDDLLEVVPETQLAPSGHMTLSQLNRRDDVRSSSSLSEFNPDLFLDLDEPTTIADQSTTSTTSSFWANREAEQSQTIRQPSRSGATPNTASRMRRDSSKSGTQLSLTQGTSNTQGTRGILDASQEEDSYRTAFERASQISQDEDSFRTAVEQQSQTHGTAVGPTRRVSGVRFTSSSHGVTGQRQVSPEFVYRRTETSRLKTDQKPTSSLSRDSQGNSSTQATDSSKKRASPPVEDGIASTKRPKGAVDSQIASQSNRPKPAVVRYSRSMMNSQSAGIAASALPSPAQHTKMRTSSVATQKGQQGAPDNKTSGQRRSTRKNDRFSSRFDQELGDR